MTMKYISVRVLPYLIIVQYTIKLYEKAMTFHWLSCIIMTIRFGGIDLNKIKKKVIIGISLGAINIVISFTYFLFAKGKGYPFIDSMFVIGLIYLIYGGISFSFEQGFFNGPRYFFKKLTHFKQGVKEEDPEEMSLTEFIRSRPDKAESTMPVFFAGAGMIILSFILGIGV
jgi:hypothetical protein